MRKFFSTFFLMASATVLLPTPAYVAQTQQEPDGSYLGKSLKRFLQSFDNDKTTQYIAAFYDLKGNGGRDAVIYLIGPKWCGSGGCNTLVLAPNADSWRIVSNETITRPPIRVLTSTSNGWRNIGVWVQGGGVQPGYEAELRFDGKRYRSNPAWRSDGKVAGEIVVRSSQEGKPLYP